MAVGGRYDSLVGVKASATLASKQYYVVKASSTAGEVKAAAAATDKLLGIVQNDPAAGEVADVAINGFVKAAGEASISYGDALTASSTGRVKSTTTNGHHVIGTALEATSSAGDIIRVLMMNCYYRTTS